MAVLTVPKPLREKLGDEAVDSLVELLNKSEEKTKQDVITLSEDKYERRLTEEISDVKIEIGNLGNKFERRLSEETSNIRIEIGLLKGEIIALEERFERRLSEEISQLRVEMSKNYASIIKWMFIFWLGQIGAIFGILFAFFKS